MDAISEKHAGLISSLTKLFNLLISMRYLSPSHVILPPHLSETIATDTFQKLGFEPEVIKLTKLLPILRSDIVWGYQQQGIELLPASKAVSYFADCSDPDWIEDLRWGDYVHSESHKLLPPWMLRLTSGAFNNGRRGVDLIYNTRDRTIVEWARVGNKLWDESPSRPAETVLEDIVQKLQSLEWVPYYDADDHDDPPARQIVQDPIAVWNLFPAAIRLPLDTSAAIQHLTQEFGPGSADDLRGSINRWRALQKLYCDCGWGTENFDGEAFERKRAEFIAMWKEMDMLFPRHGERLLSAEEFSSTWNNFWVQTVGENVV